MSTTGSADLSSVQVGRIYSLKYYAHVSSVVVNILWHRCTRILCYSSLYRLEQLHAYPMCRCSCTRILYTVVCTLWRGCTHILCTVPAVLNKTSPFLIVSDFTGKNLIRSPLSCLRFVPHGFYEIPRETPDCSVIIVARLGTMSKGPGRLWRKSNRGHFPQE